jgi:hypothetical protein
MRVQATGGARQRPGRGACRWCLLTGHGGGHGVSDGLKYGNATTYAAYSMGATSSKNVSTESHRPSTGPCAGGRADCGPQPLTRNQAPRILPASASDAEGAMRMRLPDARGRSLFWCEAPASTELPARDRECAVRAEDGKESAMRARQVARGGDAVGGGGAWRCGSHRGVVWVLT